jgi:hypothetical protein
MEMEKTNTEARPGLGRAGDTEQIGTHREILFDDFNSSPGNKWGKEKNKFFGDFGSPQCIPCTKSEDQLNKFSQDKQNPKPRNIRNS